VLLRCQRFAPPAQQGYSSAKSSKPAAIRTLKAGMRMPFFFFFFASAGSGVAAHERWRLRSQRRQRYVVLSALKGPCAGAAIPRTLTEKSPAVPSPPP